jgi:hypothetical protein
MEISASKRLSVSNKKPETKFNDRKKEYYRYNVFYNKMANQIREDYNAKSKEFKDGKYHRYENAADIVTSARELLSRNPSSM